jgi:hypothetical protein
MALRYVLGRDERALRADELPFLPGQPGLGARRELGRLACVARDERRRQAAALPEVVVVDLRDGSAEAVRELRLRGLDVLALALERSRLGEVQLDRQDGDEPGAASSGAPQDSSAGAPAGTGSSSEVRSTSRVS